MEASSTFGRSIDVDGDEWIDLGPAREANAPRQVPLATRTTPTLKVPIYQPHSKAKHEEVKQNTTKGKAVDTPTDQIGEGIKLTVSPQNSLVKSKAARSKESLMAFYLGRAKEMEEKHRKGVAKHVEVAHAAPV